MFRLEEDAGCIGRIHLGIGERAAFGATEVVYVKRKEFFLAVSVGFGRGVVCLYDAAVAAADKEDDIPAVAGQELVARELVLPSVCAR